MNINLLAPINQLSYGNVGLNTLLELQKLGAEVALFPIGQIQVGEKYHQSIGHALQRARNPDFSAPSLRIFHEHSLAEHVGRGKRVAWPIFEKNRFSELEKNHLGNQDELIVCSKWAKSVILNNSDKNWPTPHVVPLGVDRSIFNEELRKYLQIHRTNPQLYGDLCSVMDKFIFWHNAKIEIRKGHSFLHEVFYDAFSDKEDVELWVSWGNPFLSPDEVSKWERMYKERLGNKVRFIPWLNTQDEIADVISLTDCGVWPSLSEGFNLPALEYLSTGRPVIATDYSGHSEFLTEENSYLIKCCEFEEAYDSQWFFGGFDWVKFGDNQKDQLIQHMRDAYNNRRDLRTNALETAKRFTWQNSAKTLIEALK